MARIDPVTTRLRIKTKLKGNMIEFGRVVAPEMYNVKSAPFHYELGNYLINDLIQKLNVSASRGHAKSSIVGCIFPLYHIMYEPGPKLIILVSRTQDHAIKLLGSIRDILDYSANFRRIYGYWGKYSSIEWNQAQVKLKDGTMIICKGIGQQIRGIKVGNQRPTLIIADDLQDESNTKTSEVMTGDMKWFLQAASYALDPIRGRIVNIATPQHQLCISEQLKGADGWTNLHYAPVWEDDNKVALWDAWVPVSKLQGWYDEADSLNRKSIFFREILCQIVADEEQLFKEDDLRYYTGHFELTPSHDGILHVTSMDKEPCDKHIPINVFTGIDPASSMAARADYSVTFNLGIDKSMNRWILPYWRKHANPLEHSVQIVDNFKTYRPEITRVESIAYQEMLRQTVKALSEQQNLFIPGLEIKETPRQKKSDRLTGLQAIPAQRKLFIMENMTEFIQEALLYPRGKHDDLLDGFWLANKRVYPPTHVNDTTPQVVKRKIVENHFTA